MGKRTKEFRLGDIFEISKTDSCNNDSLTSGNTYDYITRTNKNNGVHSYTGFIDGVELNDGNTLSLELMNLSFYYRYRPWYAGQFVRCVKSKIPFNEYSYLYFTSIFNKVSKVLKTVLVRDVDRTFNEFIVELPVTEDDTVDYEFINNYLSAVSKNIVKNIVSEQDKELKILGGLVGDYVDIDVLEEPHGYKEFKLSDLFDIRPTKTYKGLKSKDFVKEGCRVIVNSSKNNGVGGYLDKEATEQGGIITFSDTTTSDAIFVQDSPFIGFSHIQGMYPKTDDFTLGCLLYFTAKFKKITEGRFDYATKFNRKLVMDMLIELPVTVSNEIDYEYMEKYISAVEASYVRRLEAYLRVTGLDDITLTVEEETALRAKPLRLHYKLGDLFEKLKVNKLKYKAKDVSKVEDSVYNLRVLTAGKDNQGLIGYLPRDGATVLKNCISISANGANTGVTFYQSEEFTVLQDSYAIRHKSMDLNENIGLYFVSAIRGSIYGNFDWSNKAGWERVKDRNIELPVTTSNEIDYSYMENYISAIKKQTIKNLYNDAILNIETTQSLIKEQA